MARLDRGRLTCAPLFVALAFALASCAGATNLPTTTAAGAAASHQTGAVHRSNGIEHVIIVIQENRSFDDLFATFPGADGATGGCMKPISKQFRRVHRLAGSGRCASGDQYVPLRKANLYEPCDFGHGYSGFLVNLDHGLMDGFGLPPSVCDGHTKEAYQHVNPHQIAPYYAIAQDYVLADHMFQTQGSGSFTAHQDLIRGGTTLNANQTSTIVDQPTAGPWGCDAPPGTKTDELRYGSKGLRYVHDKGPFPCLNYPTMRDLLDAQSVSWKYYSPPVTKGPQGTGALWNAFDAIRAVRYGPEWGTKVTTTDLAIFNDIHYGQLPAVSWVIPDRQNSDHPAGGPHTDTGPSWVASIVNAVGESSYWRSTAVIVVWDDWGGFYDHEAPPLKDDWGGLGFRVPMLVVSAYTPSAGTGKTFISHTPYEFGSILKFIEQNFGLGSLGTTDQRATSIADCFDFSQGPRSFRQIPTKYSRAYFLRQKPSYQPVDTQ